MFLSTMTRPDLAYAVNKLGRYSHNPSELHWQAAKRVLRYLKGTTHYGITFHWDENELPVMAYMDADWGGDLETRRSTSGSVILFLGGPAFWESHLQKGVTTSSTEAEYVALSEGCRTIIWMKQLLRELGYSSTAFDNVVTYCDNEAAVAIAENNSTPKRTKHIDIRFHWIKEQVKANELTLHHCPTADQIADGLTKALESAKFKKFLEQLRIN